MSDLFYKVLEMSIYGSIAILAVLLFRLVFRKCPKKILIFFWIAVAIRLVIPFNFNSPTSALNIGKLFSPKIAVSENSEYDPESRLREVTTAGRRDEITVLQSAGGTSGDEMSYEVGNPAQEAVDGSGKNSRLSVWNVIPVVWLGVAGAMLLFSLVRYMIFYSKARWSSRSFDGRYYMANDIDSPFVVGVIKPKIFFPINMDDDEREYVLNHEWTHIKYKDGLTKLICYIILCIHWFNPLVWVTFFMICADIEIRVDEDTTSSFNLAMVKEYCKSLVRHAAEDRGGAFMQSTAFTGLGFGGMETKLRVKNLLDNKISSLVVQIVAIAVSMIFALLLSAASIDHKEPVKRAVNETDITSAAQSTETAAPSEMTGNSGFTDDGTRNTEGGATDNTNETSVASETSETTSETTEGTPTPTPTTTPVPVETKPSISDMQEGTIFTFDGKYRNPQLDCTYGTFDIKASANDRIKVTFNGKVYELSIKNNYMSMYLNTAFLAKAYGEVYLYVALTREVGSTQACDLDVYRVTDDSITFVGVCEGLIIRIINSTNEIFCYEDVPYGGCVQVSRNYRICPGGLMEQSDNVCDLYPITGTTVKKPLTGFVVKDGRITDEERTIFPGEVAFPVYVNVAEYIDFKDNDGAIIRVDFKNEFNTYYSAGDPR